MSSRHSLGAGARMRCADVWPACALTLYASMLSRTVRILGGDTKGRIGGGSPAA